MQVGTMLKAIRQDKNNIDNELEIATSEMRLVKDDFEISELKNACEISAEAFNNVLKVLKDAKNEEKGERVLQGEFDKTAIIKGNFIGYSSIIASGENATYLHWIRNTGPVKDGDLILIDAGIEVDSLYTADITRTFPVNGKFSETQAKVYNAVLEAADAGFEAAKLGEKFSNVHSAALKVLAKYLEEWGIMPISAQEALNSEKQYHRRWMPHGTSHHLGLDVHDCARARKELYASGTIKEGMVFTIEPGLYFRSDDEFVPDEFKGIGIRIEDDILITKNGPERISHHLPRKLEEVEKWVQKFSS
jgi:Xaa-Pro aminopeptidase